MYAGLLRSELPSSVCVPLTATMPLTLQLLFLTSP